MKKEELVKRLGETEWEDFEVTEARSAVPKNCWKDISAFSNASGGWLVFGVSKKEKPFSIVGVSYSGRISYDLITALRGGKFNRKINVECRKYSFPQGTVLAFRIPEAPVSEKPVYFGSLSNSFMRYGSCSVRMTPDEIDCFFRQAALRRGLSESPLFSNREIDSESLKEYRKWFDKANPRKVYEDVEFLERIGALRDGKLTLGGLLVFGREDAIARHLENYRIDYLEFPGESSSCGFSFRISSRKNLFLTFLDIYGRMCEREGFPFSINDFFRDDVPSSLRIFREALVNMLVHSDYSGSSHLRIRFFSNWFEFLNPGSPPRNLNMTIKEEMSHPRNPVVAKLFRLAGLSEGIGGGIERMIGGWSRHYGLAPNMVTDFNSFKIVFMIPDSDKGNFGKTPGDQSVEIAPVIQKT